MTVEQALRKCREYLETAQIEDSAVEAACLAQKVFGLNRTGLISHGSDSINNECFDKLISLAARRTMREPLQYILGEWSFCGFDFCVGSGVLIPRDDTEVVVNLCRDFLETQPCKNTIDLCAGSGAISVALEKLSNAKVTAVELSDIAFSYLQKNLARNNCTAEAVKGDIFSCHTQFADGCYNLIVSNPPYIKSDEIPTLQQEVQKEPQMALDGGADGYDFYKAIIKKWSKKLSKGGALAFELGENQADFVAESLRKQGFNNIRTAFDLSNTKRAIIGNLS